jgi:hypothetical protein
METVCFSETLVSTRLIVVKIEYGKLTSCILRKVEMSRFY